MAAVKHFIADFYNIDMMNLFYKGNSVVKWISAITAKPFIFLRELKYLRNGGSLSGKVFYNKKKNTFFFFFYKGEVWLDNLKLEKKLFYWVGNCSWFANGNIMKSNIRVRVTVLFLYFNSFYLVDLNSAFYIYQFELSINLSILSCLRI